MCTMTVYNDSYGDFWEICIYDVRKFENMRCDDSSSLLNWLPKIISQLSALEIFFENVSHVYIYVCIYIYSYIYACTKL